ncbi:neck protein [Streptomyces phage Rowa]|uniref:Uncharacterized protein n=1 Tax=Streptomyces phage Rowa TaxID=2059883 RepID=A0A2H5BLY4_9CAUD|nr:neck protein [Streptomyces phage Rowa]AUG87275.1 hypothetical protein SEA_ROWA_10 [Streptomyces phage Rowa]
MSNVNIRYNFDFIRGLAKSEGAQRVVLAKARDIDAALRSVGVQTKVDTQDGPNRARAAVIAGYEDGATAEGTRRNLLLALDAAADPVE